MGGLTRNTGLVPVFAWRAAARFLEAALQAASSSEAKVCLECPDAVFLTAWPRRQPMLAGHLWPRRLLLLGACQRSLTAD